MTKELDRNPRKALGKGLSALLPARSGAAPATAPIPSPSPAPEPTPVTPLPGDFEEFASIPLDHIQPNEDQPRTAFDVEKLQELAHSIKVNGLLQPITVYAIGPKRYRLIAGERRWRAARQAGLTEIPALVRTIEQQQRMEFALVENIQREDLNPIEIATAFHNLASQHSLSHEQIAERTGKERSTVTNFLRLLRLPSSVQNALISGEISMGHARVLLALPDEPSQAQFSRRIIEHGLSVRETERLIKELTSRPAASSVKPIPKAPESEAKPIDPNTRAALDEMAAALGTKVTLHAKGPNAGRLEIEYYSQEDLERVYSVIVR